MEYCGGGGVRSTLQIYNSVDLVKRRPNLLFICITRKGELRFNIIIVTLAYMFRLKVVIAQAIRPHKIVGRGFEKQLYVDEN